MDVSGAACPYSSPSDPCKAGCSKCCPAWEQWHHSPSLSPTLPDEASGTKCVNYGELLPCVGGSVCSGVSGSVSRHRVPAASSWMGPQHELQETSSVLSTRVNNIGAKKGKLFPFLFLFFFFVFSAGIFILRGTWWQVKRQIIPAKSQALYKCTTETDAYIDLQSAERCR